MQNFLSCDGLQFVVKRDNARDGGLTVADEVTAASGVTASGGVIVTDEVTAASGVTVAGRGNRCERGNRHGRGNRRGRGLTVTDEVTASDGITASGGVTAAGGITVECENPPRIVTTERASPRPLKRGNSAL